MAGTKAGGVKAAQRNKERHGKDFYARIGAAGGKKSRNGGFAANRELARIAGAKGGAKSRRTKTVKDPVVIDIVTTASAAKPKTPVTPEPVLTKKDFDLAG